MTATEIGVDSLDAAVRQLVTLGEKDPLTIARKIEQRYEEEWIKEQLYALREEIISDLARARLNGARQSAMKALRKGQPMTKKELLLKGEWVPNHGWKKLSDWTEADLIARANYYRKISGTALRLAEWCEECASLVREEKVQKLGQVKSDLPELDHSVEEILNGNGSIEDVA